MPGWARKRRGSTCPGWSRCARRLAGLLPAGRLAEVAGGYTLIPLDQPAKLARLIRGFAA
jgi:hypothetical protein